MTEHSALVPALFDAFTVARLGSVAAAAKQLGKTPSAVSQQLRNLAELSGVTLFERRGRGIRLTPAGERVLPLATRLFDEVETLFRLFGELSGEATTTLRIAASDYLARPLLVPVLHELAAEGVPIHFEITTAHSEDALARLERGDVEPEVAQHAESLRARDLVDQVQPDEHLSLAVRQRRHAVTIPNLLKQVLAHAESMREANHLVY